MTDERGIPVPERDTLSRGMDEWQIECRLRLMTEYGHPWARAAVLAMSMRLMLEADLRKPRPLILLSGV